MAAAATSNTQFNDLKEIVSKTLEKQGILAKAQAQLRKHVFEALSTTEQQNPTKYNTSPQIDVTDINDQFAMALIRDFLEYHHLDYTLSLMNTESQKKMETTQNITRNEMASRLGLGAQKPNAECSLLKLLVKKMFDNDVFKPRNSTLDNDITLKPRISNDSYRSSLDSASFSLMNKEINTNDKVDRSVIEDEKYNNVLQSLELSLPKAKELPPLPIQKKQSDTFQAGEISQRSNTMAIDVDQLIHETMEIDAIDVDDLLDGNSSTKSETKNTEAYTDPMDDVIDDLLESSSSDDEEENVKQVDEWDATNEIKESMQRMGLQASELAKLEKKSVLLSRSAVSSQTGTEITEYEDDFGSDVIETQEPNDDNNDIGIIEEDIDEEIDEDIDEESQSISEDIEDEDNADNIYAAKDLDQETNDEAISKNFKLENVADIIMDVKTEKIKYQF